MTLEEQQEWNFFYIKKFIWIYLSTLKIYWFIKMIHNLVFVNFIYYLLCKVVKISA